MSPVVRICHRHRATFTGRCPSCASERLERQKIHTHKRGRNFRREILERDNFICAYCGNQAGQLDYVRALSIGGVPFDETNAVACCADCNAKRGAEISNGGISRGGEF